MTQNHEPPDSLGEAGRDFWSRILSEFSLDEAHDLMRLEVACRWLDDEAAAMAAIERDGRFIRNRYGGLVEHPAAKTIQASRIGFLRAVRELGLDLQTENDERFRPRRQYE